MGKRSFFQFFTFFNLSFLLFALVLCGVMYAITQIPSSYIVRFDIRGLYTGGVMVHHGVRDQLYDLVTQYEWQKKIFPSSTPSGLMAFLNPPVLALVLSPFAVLPIKNVYTIIAVINTGIILSCVYLLIREIGVKEKKYIFLYIFSIFYFPIVATLIQAQVSFILFLGVLGSWFCFKREKSIAAGVFLSLLFIRPNLLILPCMLLIWKKQWSALFGLLSSLTIFLLISWSTVGLTGLEGYIRLLFSIASFGDAYTVHPQMEPTLRGLLEFIYHSNFLSVIILPYIVSLFLAGVGFFLAWKGSWDTKHARFTMQWAVLLIVMLLTSVHTNYHDLMLLFFPCVILLVSVKKNLLRYIIGILIDFSLFIFFIPTPFISLFVLIMLVILGWYLVRLFPKIFCYI